MTTAHGRSVNTPGKRGRGLYLKYSPEDEAGSSRRRQANDPGDRARTASRTCSRRPTGDHPGGTNVQTERPTTELDDRSTTRRPGPGRVPAAPAGRASTNREPSPGRAGRLRYGLCCRRPDFSDDKISSAYRSRTRHGGTASGDYLQLPVNAPSSGRRRTSGTAVARGRRERREPARELRAELAGRAGASGGPAPTTPEVGSRMRRKLARTNVPRPASASGRCGTGDDLVTNMIDLLGQCDSRTRSGSSTISRVRPGDARRRVPRPRPR